MDKKQKNETKLKKTKNIIFNYTNKYQFTTDLSVNDKNIEVVKETKLLGTYITDDLKWNKNTSEIVKKANKRMPILTKSAAFTTNRQDLKRIYLTYISLVFLISRLLSGTAVLAKRIQMILKEYRK